MMKRPFGRANLVWYEVIDDLAASDVSSTHEHAPEYGERSRRIKGRVCDVIYWDAGNGWAWVQQLILSDPATYGSWPYTPDRAYGPIYRHLARVFNRLADIADEPQLQGS